MKREYSSELVKDFLTEKRYWTFWSKGWEKCKHIKWNGKTPFKQVVSKMEKILGAEMMYELSTSIPKRFDFTFD